MSKVFNLNRISSNESLNRDDSLHKAPVLLFLVVR